MLKSDLHKLFNSLGHVFYVSFLYLEHTQNNSILQVFKDIFVKLGDAGGSNSDPEHQPSLYMPYGCLHAYLFHPPIRGQLSKLLVLYKDEGGPFTSDLIHCTIGLDCLT